MTKFREHRQRLGTVCGKNDNTCLRGQQLLFQSLAELEEQLGRLDGILTADAARELPRLYDSSLEWDRVELGCM